jgi:hypothetical protein
VLPSVVCNGVCCIPSTAPCTPLAQCCNGTCVNNRCP